MHALMESRTKEALWLGDMDLALARTLKVIDVDPYDSKAWAEVGEVHYLREEWQQAAEAYAVAAMLGPPASAVGRHLAGVCLRKLDQGGLAALLFKSALDFDPLGISPRQEILNLPDIPVLKALKEWSRGTTEQ
jgi:cytochrome c-type biogenesis protein CcmH/NrfG